MALNNIIFKDTQSNTVTGAMSNNQIDLKFCTGYSMIIGTTNTTPGALGFTSAGVSTANSTITITGHGLATGTVGQFTTTGTLPTGLSTSTNYYVIVVDVNTISLATSYANALAGTKITLSAAGSGSSTFTPTALGTMTATLSASNDGVTWAAIASATTVTVGTPLILPSQANPPQVYYRYVKASFTLASGQVLTTSVTQGRE